MLVAHKAASQERLSWLRVFWVLFFYYDRLSSFSTLFFSFLQINPLLFVKQELRYYFYQNCLFVLMLRFSMNTISQHCQLYHWIYSFKYCFLFFFFLIILFLFVISLQESSSESYANFLQIPIAVSVSPSFNASNAGSSVIGFPL